MSFLSVEGVSKRYGSVVALDGVSFAAPAGSRTAIVGASGSGKTTLLRIIAGFEPADAGRVVVDGDVLVNGTTGVPTHLRNIGFVPQDGALFPHLSVADNIGFGLPKDTPGRGARILALMDMVGIDRKSAERRPHQLSGGQQQRVALARALARQPKVMLLDEPFSALDTGLRESVRSAVAGVLSAANVTALLVTHDQAEALSFAHQVAILREGRLMQVGSPRDLYLAPRDPGTAAFLGDAIVLTAMLGEGWVECALGRVSCPAASPGGTARIMLRPDQVRLSPLPLTGEPALAGGASLGEIREIRFGGARCSVVVALVGGPLPSDLTTGPPAPGPEPITVYSAAADLPEIGTMVRMTVVGEAHLFPGGA